MYAYVPNFVSIGLFCRPLAAKTINFVDFWTSAFCGVANWQQSEKVEHRCTTTNIPLSRGVKVISAYYSAFEEKSSAQTLTFKSVTNRQRQTKSSTLLASPAAGEIRAAKTWHGDKGPRALSCTSKTFGVFSPTVGDRINRSRQNLAHKRIPWVCYSTPNLAAIGKSGSVQEPPNVKMCQKLWVLATGSRHSEHIQMNAEVQKCWAYSD